jgi:hypothetical protein
LLELEVVLFHYVLFISFHVHRLLYMI